MNNGQQRITLCKYVTSSAIENLIYSFFIIFFNVFFVSSHKLQKIISSYESHL